MGVDTCGVPLRDAGEALASAIVDLLRATGMPNGLSALGYTSADVDRLVQERHCDRAVFQHGNWKSDANILSD